MSTRCRIGFRLPNGEVKSIYCHHDGYPEGAGETLKEYYNDPKKIEELLELGDISSLGTHYDKDLAKLDWEKPYSELSDEQKKALETNTLPYSDRGENVPARIDTFGEFYEKLGKCGEEYTYLYDTDWSGVYKWRICETPYFKDYGEEKDA